MDDMVEVVARAVREALYGHCDPADTPNTWGAAVHAARIAIEAMRNMTLVYRQNGAVVHELRGAPDDIWKTLLDAALSEHPSSKEIEG